MGGSMTHINKGEIYLDKERNQMIADGQLIVEEFDRVAVIG
jgi:hypothetical protein